MKSLALLLYLPTVALACINDPWHKEATVEQHWVMLEAPLDRSKFTEVSDKQRALAIGRLQNVPALKLNEKEIRLFADNWPPGFVGHVYLLRAIRYPTTNSSFH